LRLAICQAYCYSVYKADMPGTLYLVATPIGNLNDMSPRAVDTLRSVDVIACEDTRHTQKLLNHFGIKAKTVSYHEHNEHERVPELIGLLGTGSDVALVSDAGTPGINDPAFRIVAAASGAGIDVIPIPGPAAFVSAAIVSGLPTDSIFFAGFLPSKKGDRRKRLSELIPIPATMVFYESPHRLIASLADCLDVLGDRRASISRELTKLHEETLRGRISELISSISSAKPRGEYVLVIDRDRDGDAVQAVSSSKGLQELVAELEATGLDRKAALKKAAKELGLSRSEAYRMLHS
jgi:16S rRNA (cytidine1402-2'-O)-methyltransferase